MVARLRQVAGGAFVMTAVALFGAWGEDGLLDANLDIPYEKFVLANGLTLIVHEDPKAPIVAVNVWYHVGSKNEKAGKTGFAHLFEHLMFNGTEHYNDDYFKPLEKAGATDMNGTTNNDRTNYFQNVPTSALDIALWMESDRMGHLLGAIDQAKLDEQRGVVQNEKRQGENQPYGLARELIPQNTYPAGHPYSWSVIGSMEDLDAASLEDVHEWFQQYYGAANAVIAIAGDVDAADVKARVEKYFGHIPSGPPVTKHETWVAKRTGEQRQLMYDRVPQARVYKVWNVPEWGARDTEYLNLVSDLLADGKNSRLYKRLVYEDQIATDVSAYISPKEIAGQFMIVATAKPGVDLATVERAVDEELARVVEKGPTAEELKRIKTQYFARFIRGAERIGGFGGKSDILAMNEVYGGSPDSYKMALDYARGATVKDLQRAAQDWLTDGVYVLEIHPFPEYTTQPQEVDRTQGVPIAGAPPEARFPDIQRAELSNGLKIVLAERHAVPIVTMDLLVDAGGAADAHHGKAGLASIALDMLDEGAAGMSALEISEALALLGAELGTSNSRDTSFVSLNALKANLSESLDIFADVILRPTFDAGEFDRKKAQQLAGIKQSQASPQGAGSRVFPALVYGKGHPYATPLSGTEQSVNSLELSDLAAFHETWFKPNNATLVVVGDTTLAEFVPLVEKKLAEWQSGEVPEMDIAEVEYATSDVIYLIDRPGAQQSYIFAGHLAPPKSGDAETAIEIMNRVLGGSFTSRINMNLREDKHWSYGARSSIIDAQGPRLFLATAPVQTDKTKESIEELVKEFEGIVGKIPILEEELEKSKLNRTLALPGQWETASAVKGSLSEIIIYGLPEDHYETYASRISALKLAELETAAKDVVRPDQVVWLVVGDRAKIEDGIRELNMGEPRVIRDETEVLQ